MIKTMVLKFFRMAPWIRIRKFLDKDWNLRIKVHVWGALERVWLAQRNNFDGTKIRTTEKSNISKIKLSKFWFVKFYVEIGHFREF